MQWSGETAPQLIGARFTERTSPVATRPRATLTVLVDPDLRDSFLVDVPRALRPLWLVGAGLLGAVVVKLFMVDLSGQGTIERIVSFVGVGALILVIGYLAPVPPSQDSATRSAT